MTRKKLLFVDDEPLVLQGLRRALHGMRETWEMNFVGGGAEALQVLSGEAYDAIVSDMRMPGLDGAQLLEEVKRQHPEMLRFVLSGQSNREAVLRSVSPAHQYISKPCDPQELNLRLTQAFAMRDQLNSESVKALVSGLKSIPSLPALYDELMAELRSDDPSVVKIGRIISSDVGMSAKILQLANSAFIGLRCHVSSPTQAVAMIGCDLVRALVLSVHVFSQFKGVSDTEHHWGCLWEHSVRVAALAQRIAAFERSAKLLLEESFTAGLLHDVGKAILLAEMPAEYIRILGRVPPEAQLTAEIEREALGCTHADIGAYLMGTWGLPHPLVHAVLFHDRPSQSLDRRFGSLAAVHVADVIVTSGDHSAINRDIQLDQQFLQESGLAGKEVQWMALYQEQCTQKQAKGLV